MTIDPENIPLTPMLAAAPHPFLPGAVNIVVHAAPNIESALSRIDGSLAAQPVRNYSNTTDDGIDTVTDCEAPLGRPIHYNLTDVWGTVIATSNVVTPPPLPSGRALLRSVLAPSVAWLEVEPQDEKNVEWKSSTSIHEIVGKDTPTVIGEVRQRHSGTMTFLARSISEADNMLRLMKDGSALLLRHDPCAQMQTRDVLMYVQDVNEVRWGRQGWRLIVCDYQSTAFVPGSTIEPAWGEWTFAHLRDSAPDFGVQASLWANFLFQTLLPFPAWTGRTGTAPTRALIEDAW